MYLSSISYQPQIIKNSNTPNFQAKPQQVIESGIKTATQDPSVTVKKVGALFATLLTTIAGFLGLKKANNNTDATEAPAARRVDDIKAEKANNNTDATEAPAARRVDDIKAEKVKTWEELFEKAQEIYEINESAVENAKNNYDKIRLEAVEARDSVIIPARDEYNSKLDELCINVFGKKVENPKESLDKYVKDEYNRLVDRPGPYSHSVISAAYYRLVNEPGPYSHSKINNAYYQLVNEPGCYSHSRVNDAHKDFRAGKITELEFLQIKKEAQAEYDKIKAAAQAEYDEIVAKAHAEYDEIVAKAQAEYNEITVNVYNPLQEAYKKYSNIVQAARDKYSSVVAPIEKEYNDLAIPNKELKSSINKLKEKIQYGRYTGKIGHRISVEKGIEKILAAAKEEKHSEDIAYANWLIAREKEKSESFDDSEISREELIARSYDPYNPEEAWYWRTHGCSKHEFTQSAGGN